MSVLVLVVALLGLSALTGLFLWYPARYAARGGIDLARTDALVSAYEARTRELAEEAERGQLTAAEHASVQAELDRQLLADTAQEDGVRARGGQPRMLWSVGLTAGIALASVAIYPAVGAWEEVQTYDALGATSSPTQAAVIWRDYLDGQAEPAPQFLYELASAERFAGDLDRAVVTLQRVAARLRAIENSDPEDLSAVLSETAELRYRLNGEQLNASIEAEFQEALRLDPLNGQALATLGVAYFSAGELASAIELWEKFLDVAPAGSARDAVAQILEQAQRQLDAGGAPEAGEAGVQVLISGLPDTIAPDAQVYVVASEVEGNQPVAIQRIAAGDLPPAVQLTDQHRGAGMPPLSSLEQVSVLAFVVPAEAESLAAATWRSEPVVLTLSSGERVVSLRLRPAATP